MDLPSLQQNLANQESAHTIWHSFQTNFTEEKNYLAFGHTLYTSTIYELETDAVRIEEGSPEQGSPSFPLLSRIEEHCVKNRSLKETAERIIGQIRRINVRSNSLKSSSEWTVRAEKLFEQAMIDLDTICVVDGALFTENKSIRNLVTIRIHFDELVVATDPQTMDTNLQESFDEATIHGDAALVELLLEDERVTPLYHINHARKSVCPLSNAIRNGNLKTAKILIADRRVRDYLVNDRINDSLMLNSAICSRKVELVQFVLGLDFFDPTLVDWTQIFELAIDFPQIDVIRELMSLRYPSGDLCVDPTGYDNYALRSLCVDFLDKKSKKDLEIIKFLLTDERVQQSLIAHNFYDEPYYGVMHVLPKEITELFREM